MLDNKYLEIAIDILSGANLWLYFTIIVAAFYLIIALFTWSFRRPLKFIGTPSIIAGVLFVAIYFIPLLFPLSDSIQSLVKSILNPFFNIGLVCLIMGVVMVILSKILNILFKNRNKDTKIKLNKEKLDVELSVDDNTDEEEEVIKDKMYE